jgi:Mrp family chromosome partitioning ATPase
MSTNQAFIKAFRRDGPRGASPAPSPARPASPHVHPPANVSVGTLWQTSVEIVAPDFEFAPLPALAKQPTPLVAPPVAPSIGKRPLSSFAAEPAFELPQPPSEPAFRPETAISAFHWPPICRALWDQSADDYQRVADLLLARCRREPGRGTLFGVGSLHAGDGCTTTLLCLAVALAATNTRLILVDANFRAPRLAALLGVEPATCWQDVLENGLPVAEAVIRAENDHVDLLPLAARSLNGCEPNGAQLAAGLQTSITAGVLRYAYDLVLVDLGAVLAPRSFDSISQLIRNMRIDAAIAVADRKHAERDDLAVAGELVEETGCELLGVIENRAKPPVADRPWPAAI